MLSLTEAHSIDARHIEMYIFAIIIASMNSSNNNNIAGNDDYNMKSKQCVLNISHSIQNTQFQLCVVFFRTYELLTKRPPIDSMSCRGISRLHTHTQCVDGYAVAIEKRKNNEKSENRIIHENHTHKT